MRTIAVTGSASGIGAATRRRLEQDGHRVIGVDLRNDDVVADLGTAAGRASAIAAVRDACGGQLDGLVSGAALGPTEAAEPVLRVNCFGALQILDGLLEPLAAAERPAAVAIASIGAVFDAVMVPDVLEACCAGDEERAVRAAAGIDGNTAYCITKRALALGVRERASAWGARGVRLNALAPGSIETPMLDRILAHEGLGPAVEGMPIPIGRKGGPEDMADVIAFLLGPDSRYVHGTVLHADGGADAIVRPDAL